MSRSQIHVRNIPQVYPVYESWLSRIYLPDGLTGAATQYWPVIGLSPERHPARVPVWPWQWWGNCLQIWSELPLICASVNSCIIYIHVYKLFFLLFAVVCYWFHARRRIYVWGVVSSSFIILLAYHWWRSMPLLDGCFFLFLYGALALFAEGPENTQSKKSLSLRLPTPSALSS